MTDANDATPAPPPPAAPAPAAAGGWGPVGRPRSWIVVVLLSIITLGIYFLYWNFRVFQDMKNHMGAGLGGVLALIFAIIPPLGIVNLFVLPSEIGNMYERAGLEKPTSWVTALWNLIPIIGGLIWLAKVQGAMNRRWESTGA